ncbi:MAG: glycosyltransferase [Planctomycetes bacterium]|nr:glycosyltransferase [Planctomycetota bacterium]
MHVLFIHQNFPAQFGHIAAYLVQQKRFRCTFLSEQPPQAFGGIECVQYKLQGGATPATHFCSRTFENAIWHSHAAFQALQARPDIKPDLVVAHSGFLSTVFLRELYDCPIVNYFEYYYRTHGSDMDFRPEFPNPAMNALRAHARNAVALLDLENCDIGYSPTRWQRSLFPRLFQDKIRAIFDGIDTNIWRPLPTGPRRLGDRVFPEGTRIVTYVSRGMESIRGFDIFMKVAKRICQRRSDVVFLVVGDDRVCYGGDLDFTGGKSFKQWVLDRDDYDLSRFIFTGPIPIGTLVQVFALSDLHIYLTVPFVLSWSMLNALACGATVLASNTPPVREVIEPGKTGLLEDFFDVDRLSDQALRVLDAPGDFNPLGQAGVELIRNRYSLDVCLPRMLALYEDAVHARH